MPSQSNDDRGDEIREKINKLKDMGLLEVHPEDREKPWGEQRLRRTAKGELVGLSTRGEGDEQN